MINLQEVFDVSWRITCAEIMAREENGHLLHHFIFSDEYDATVHQRREVEDGKLTIVLGKINAHGDPTRGGSEIGWGYKKNSIPEKLMEARITHMMLYPRYGGNGTEIIIDVELDQMSVEVLKHSLERKALKLEDMK